MSLLLLGVVMIAAAALLLHVTRSESLFADEWAFFAYRSHGWGETLFAPNNGSLVLVPLLVYRTVFKVFGPDITVFRLILVVLELVCSGLFFELARRRIGEWLALGGATLLLFLGSGWVLVTTVGITLYLAVALGLAALLALERGDRRADMIACALLVLALASYNAVLPFAAGAAIAIALRPASLRWRSAWVVVIPLLLYAAWRVWAVHYAQHPTLPLVAETVIAPGAITRTPGLVGQALAAGLASATGLFRVGREQPFFVNYSWGVPLAVLFVAAALARFRWPRRPRPARGVWVFLTMPLVYWTALSVAASQIPGTKIRFTRSPDNAGYQYTSVLLLLLAAAALASGVRIPRLARLALLAVLLASLVPNLQTLREAAAVFRFNGSINRAELAAVGLVGSGAARVLIETPQTTPDITYDLLLAPQDYLSAAADLGSVAAPASSLTKATPAARRAADLTLIRLYPLGPRPTGERAPPIAGDGSPLLEGQAAGFAQTKRGCVSVRPPVPGITLSFALPRGGISLHASEGPPVALNLRRFAGPPGLPTGNVAGGTQAILRIPRDASAQPWRLLITPAQAVRLCSLPNRTPHAKPGTA